MNNQVDAAVYLEERSARRASAAIDRSSGQSPAASHADGCESRRRAAASVASKANAWAARAAARARRDEREREGAPSARRRVRAKPDAAATEGDGDAAWNRFGAEQAAQQASRAPSTA